MSLLPYTIAVLMSLSRGQVVSKKRTDEELKIDMGAGAFMFQARDLGPVWFGVTGRKHNTTHWHTPSKAEYFLLPVESNSEMSTMFLLDISISVTKYMAQPHRLEFSSTSWMRRQIYTPDIQATVPYWFVEILRSVVPFAAAALGLPPARAVRDPLVLARRIEMQGSRIIRGSWRKPG